MLIEVSKKNYDSHFPICNNPYISSNFIEINKNKVDKVVRLLENDYKVSIGIVAGIKDSILKSPFSAPFGGFHHRKENQYISEIDIFIKKLINYSSQNNLKKIELTLPPDLYNLTFNTKIINSLIRYGFVMLTPDITNWMDLECFNWEFSNKSSRKFYNQAVKNKLNFKMIDSVREKNECYNIIAENRSRFNRPIYMTLNDLLDVGKLWGVDFFGVYDENSTIVAAGVFYRGSDFIIQGVFWGDNDKGRPLRAIDFLAYSVWCFYKNLNYKIIDLGISTEDGIPNEGLLRFKESHDCNSSLRYSFVYNL